MLFGGEFRHAREAAGYSQAGLAKLLHCDRTLITRIENGGRIPQEKFIKQCDEVLLMGGVLIRIWKRVDWYAEVEHPDWFQRFAQMEAEAVALRKFQIQHVPGLLQTEDYARALFARGAGVGDPDLIEERVAARLSRQHRFMAPDGPLLVVVLDESVIRRSVGGPAVMSGQMEHLLEVGRRPNIVLQVAPFDVGGLKPLNTSMSLVMLPDRHEWVYSESLDRGHFSDDPAVIDRHTRTYDVLRADSLSAVESAAVITSAMEGYNAHDDSRSRRSDLVQEQLQRRQRRRLHRGGPRIPGPRPRS
ncbi:helix-turn-helix transcriptional regulator [Kitasatospora sp. NBC_00240]|uniref:helix-turn-helix domain-containing protein n=1 Tax=Kitasatospora sp. NBC_00240 TaxID=2903567 RepID=UPI002B1D7FB5|nr:helix-turn-helix transcriptional regulator [Kitasatospora sp. NBC_00240]